MVFHDGALSGDDPARHENPEDDTLEARCARWLAAAAADAVMSQCPCLADPDADEQVRTRPERRGGLENEGFFAIFFAPAKRPLSSFHTRRATETHFADAAPDRSSSAASSSLSADERSAPLRSSLVRAAQPSTCARGSDAVYQTTDPPRFDDWWNIAGACIFGAVCVLSVYVCYRSRLALRDAKARALEDLLELMADEDKVLAGYESGMYVSAEQPCGKVALVKRCPDEEQTPFALALARARDGDASLSFGGRTRRVTAPGRARANVSVANHHSEAWTGLRSSSSRVVEQYYSESVWEAAPRAMCCGRRRGGRLERALARALAGDPNRLGLQQLQMASLALRRRREQRGLLNEAEFALGLRRMGGGGGGHGGGLRSIAVER